MTCRNTLSSPTKLIHMHSAGHCYCRTYIQNNPLKSFVCPLLRIPFFVVACCSSLAVTRCPPLAALSPHEQTTPRQMGFLHTMPHCISSSLPNTFGVEEDHALSRRFLRQLSPHAGKSQLWTNLSLKTQSNTQTHTHPHTHTHTHTHRHSLHTIPAVPWTALSVTVAAETGQHQGQRPSSC